MKTDRNFQEIVDRLKEELSKKSLSMRGASIAANFGPGYLQSIIANGTEPTVSKLFELCTANGLNTFYVLFGVNLSDETLQLVELMERNPETRNHVLALLGSQTSE